jgi:hypothetical protein
MDTFQYIRKALLLFFLGFPIIMLSLTGFLALGFGNTGMMFLFLGQAILVPVGVFLTHIASAITTILFPREWVFVAPTDNALLVPSDALPSEPINVAPSYWMAHVTFFFAYLLTNAGEINAMDSTADTINQKWRTENRKARSSLAIAVGAIMYALMIILRFTVTKSETFFGMLIAIGIFSVLGWGWYQAAKSAGARKGDIFGIVQQMIPIEDPSAMMCRAPVT